MKVRRCVIQILRFVLVVISGGVFVWVAAFLAGLMGSVIFLIKPEYITGNSEAIVVGLLSLVSAIGLFAIIPKSAFRKQVMISAITLATAFLIIWPTVSAFVVRRQILSALDGAESVRLEEFNFGDPLDSVELPRSEWPAIAAAMPLAPDAGVPGTIYKCFIPSHRIIIAADHGRSFTFTVCFHCDQGQIEGQQIFVVPYAWRHSLRGLFTEHHIRLRSDREYRELLSKKVEEQSHALESPKED